MSVMYLGQSLVFDPVKGEEELALQLGDEAPG
jgi:hypothetical protein